MRSLLILLQLLFLSGVAFANPSGINLSGKISLQASGAALTAADVDFKIRVLSPDGCILYSEKFDNVDLSATAGVFNLTIGNGTALYNAWDATLGTANSKASLIKVFNNASAPIASGLTQYPGEVCAGGAYTPTDGDVRRVVIEFDPTGSGNSANFVALSPFHRIRSVPYAMLADHASDSDKLGGVAASNYAKTTDIAAAVPANETDPNVQAFAKTAVTGLTAGQCGAGKVLTYDGTSLVCVTDSGGGGGGSIATNTVAGTVLVDTGSNVSLNLTTGALDVKDLAIAKITGLQTALDAKIGYTAMPATSCTAGEALVWLTPSNTFSCFAITVDTAHVSGFDTAVDARIAADTTKLPVAGGTMTGNINMGNNQLSNVGYLHLQNKAADPGGFVAGNEGFVWYNSTDKQIKYYNGTAINALPAYTGACADGQILKWNNATKIWACAADAGAGGGSNATQIQSVNVAAAAPATGQFLKYVGTEWTPTSMPVCTADQVMLFNGTGVATCTAISGLTDSSIAVAAAIARSKLASGTMNHVLINDGTGAMSSEAQLAVTRGGTGQSTYTDGQLLIGNSTGNTLTKGTLTQGAGITITNGNGTITIAADPTTATIADDSIVNADINTAAAIDRSKLANGTANRVVVNNGSGVMSDAAAITASRALISDANGIPTHSAVTSTELGYVSGVTSAIQTQLDALTTGGAGKVAKAGDTMTGNLVMNAEKEVRFADNNSDHYIGLKSPATVAADVTFTLPAADGTAGYVLKTDGSGNLAWVAPASAPGDASYAAKGVVQFQTDAATSGISVAGGVASVNTGVTADKIVKLDASAKLPAVDGSALTNIDVANIASAVGKYFGYKPNGAACVDGGVMKWDDATQHWICGTDAGSGGADASSIRGISVDATAPTANKFMQYDGTKWTSWLFPTCGTNSSLQVDALGNISCAAISGIVNSNIDAAAAIARTKLASGTADHVLINNGSGVMSSEAQLAVSRGGTGQSTYTDGQLLIGNSSGNTLSKATLTQGTGITITNGNGTITIAADPVSSIVDGSVVDADVNAAAAIARTKLANGTANRVVVNNGSGVMSDAAAITANRALISDANGIPTHSTVTSAELGYVSGVTSAIQGQLDALTTGAGAKVSKAGDTMTGNLVMNAQNAVRFADSDSDHFIGLRSPATVAGDVTFTLPAADGSPNYVLKTDGSGNLGWVALPAGTVDASYAAKGVVQLDTDLATSGLAVTSGVIKVNTGVTADKIVKLDASAKLPAVDGSALTNLDVAAITSGSGKWLSYKPDGTECADGEILKWVAATDRWVCGTAGGITSVVAGTGLDVNTVGGAATVSVEAELGALNGLSTTGYVQRTGAATYSTTSGNTLNSNSTVVLRDGSGVSGFSGVLLNNASMNVTQMAPGAGTSYSVTWPANAPSVDGQVLTSTTAGVMSWASALTTVASGDIVDGTIVDADINASAAIARTKLANGTANRVVVNNGSGVMSDAAAITANRALISDANGIPTHSTVTNTELGYLSGVTSAIQTQMDAKVAKAGDTMTGNLVMSNEKEVRFGDSGAKYIGFKSPTTITGSGLTFTLPDGDGTANQVLKTDGAGNLGWVALPAGTVDASYAAKGVVQFNTDEATSGMTVASGVATVKRTTAALASTILQLDASSKAMVKGLDLKGTTNSVTLLPAAATGAYSLTLPAADGTAGYVLKTDGSGNLGWVNPAVDSAAITDGSIMNADVNAAAAIARTKLASGTANHVLINDGSGVMSSEAQLAVSRGGTGAASFTANSLVISGATTTSPLAALSCTIGQVPFYNGTTYACSTDFVAAAVSSAVNYVLLSGSTGSSTVKINAAGTGTNLDLTLASKGTGNIVLGDSSATGSVILGGSTTTQVRTDKTLNVNGTYIERAPASTSLSGTATGTNTLPTDRNLYRVTMTANTTLYLPACPAATDTSFSMTVKVAQSGAGGFVLAWGSNGGTVTWDSGTVPDASTATTTAVSIYQFLCFAGESNVWYGMQVWKQ